MADLIQIRRDSYENWNYYNPILAEGEVGIITHSGSAALNPQRCKVGDGSTTWRNLPIQAWAEPGLSGSLNTRIDEVSGSLDTRLTDVSGSIATDILELQQSVFPLTVTFTNNATNPSEYTGTAITPTLTWTSTRSGSPITPTEVKIKQGSTVLDTQTPSTNTGTYVASVNSIGATAFTAEVTAAGMVKSVNTTVNQVLPCYVGFYTPGATVNTMKGSLTKKVISGITGISGTYSNDNATKYLTICIPNTMTIHHVKSSGFDVPMQAAVTDTSMEVGGTTRTYKVYRSASPFNVTSVAIVVD